jgi:hypothetical protein
MAERCLDDVAMRERVGRGGDTARHRPHAVLGRSGAVWCLRCRARLRRLHCRLGPLGRGGRLLRPTSM